MALRATQPPTEMCTRNLPWGKKRPAPRADNLAAIYDRQPLATLRTSTACTGKTLPTLPYLTLPYLTLPYLTLPYLTLPYLTLPYLT
jgi:hypothetical protein